MMTTETTTNGTVWNDAARASEQAALEEAHPPRVFTEEVRVKLTPVEMTARIADLTAERTKLAELEAKKKVAAKAFKSQVDVCEGIVATICAGTEEREVELREVFEWSTGRVVTCRVDTGEQVRERAIDSNERQLTLGKSPNGELFDRETGQYVDEDESDEDDDAEADS